MNFLSQFEVEDVRRLDFRFRDCSSSSGSGGGTRPRRIRRFRRRRRSRGAASPHLDMYRYCNGSKRVYARETERGRAWSVERENVYI